MNRFSHGNPSLVEPDKVSLAQVEKIVDALEIEPSDNLHVCSWEAVVVAALQMQLRRYGDLYEYITDMNRYIAAAVNCRAQIVVMPAFAGLLPMSAAPLADACLRRLASQKETPSTLSAGSAAIGIAALGDALAQLSDYAFDAYFHTMSTLAARHRVYIMSGSTLYFEDDSLRHRAFLFSDEGALVGCQDKISEGPLELALEIRPESEIKLFDTPLGPVSILIGSDAHHFEIARVAAGLGAKILLCPAVYADAYNPVDSTLGPNMRVQENRIYAAMSSLVGESGLGFSLEGGGRIFAPNELLRHKNGVAAKTNGLHQPDVAYLSLNLDRLEQIENPYTHGANKGFMAANYDKIF